MAQLFLLLVLASAAGAQVFDVTTFGAVGDVRPRTSPCSPGHMPAPAACPPAAKFCQRPAGLLNSRGPRDPTRPFAAVEDPLYLQIGKAP